MTHSIDLGDMAREPAINSAALDEMRDLYGEDDLVFIAELFELYLADTPGQLESLSRAVAAGDAGSVRRAAHTVKGSSGNVGAFRLADLCSEIEQVGRDGKFADAPEILSRIDAEFARVNIELVALIQRLSEA